jgi:hypothetical protein
MKKTVLLICAAAAVLLFSSCAPDLPSSNPYEIEMYVSLGSVSTFPPGLTLLDYWGKTVRFSVVGLDAGINNDVDLKASAAMNWTGTNPDNGTQFATARFSLKGTNGSYAGGKFKFLMYIDWDGSGTLTSGSVSGDQVMTGYSVLADTDNNSQTGATGVASSLWGSRISYNAIDYSLTIDDPRTYHSGSVGLVEKIHEGVLGLAP